MEYKSREWKWSCIILQFIAAESTMEDNLLSRSKKEHRKELCPTVFISPNDLGGVVSATVWKIIIVC